MQHKYPFYPKSRLTMRWCHIMRNNHKGYGNFLRQLHHHLHKIPKKRNLCHFFSFHPTFSCLKLTVRYHSYKAKRVLTGIQHTSPIHSKYYCTYIWATIEERVWRTWQCVHQHKILFITYDSGVHKP